MTAAAPTAKLLTFFVGEDQFAVTASDVIEIHRPPRVTRVPNGPASLLGIGSLRGMPAPIVSLARLLGRADHHADGRPSPHARLLLIDGEQTVGLAVDRVGTLSTVPAGSIETEGRKAGFGRLYQIDDRSVRALDLGSLLRQEFATHGRVERRPAAEIAAPATVSRRAELSFLAFDLAGQSYALPIDEVDEALPLPEALTGVAQSDQAVLGVTTLRDRLLPVVSLRMLLGLPERAEASDRVVVARIGEARIGLTVDRLRSILRVPESSIDPVPAVLNRGEGEAQVRSICRLENGAGLVAILSAERLFRDEKVAHILADGRNDGRNGGGMMPTTTKNGMAERFLIFRLGAEEYGLPLGAVDEVIRLPDDITRLPNAPDFVQGIVTLRGTVVPVIDQRVRLAAGPAATGLRPRIVVTTIEGRKAGFIVDTASEILAVREDDLTATPDLAAEAGRLFSRVASLDGGKRLILLIEPKELLERAERDLLARLAASLDDRPA